MFSGIQNLFMKGPRDVAAEQPQPASSTTCNPEGSPKSDSAEQSVDPSQAAASSSECRFGQPGDLGNARAYDHVDDGATQRSTTDRMLKALEDEAEEAKRMGIDEELNEH